MTKRIRKAIIPAAGFGTRFLPATKAIPKEMLPIVDKPIIQYVVEEAVASGIEVIVMVISGHKRAIEDHFDYPYDLEEHLLRSGKEQLFEELSRIGKMAQFVYVSQRGPYGNGTPVLCARDIIGDEPFAILWGDEFIYSEPPRLKQMIDAWNKHGVANISAVRVPEKAAPKYGIADIETIEPGLHRIKRIVEKPQLGQAPSNLATHGAYIMPPKLFDILADTPVGKGGELWLTDAISTLSKEQPVYAVEIQNGRYYDTGNKLEYLKTVVEFGLKHPDLGSEFRKFLKAVVL
jgi:UTP--glucose-1-phosphate uridylyltransferase